MTVKNKKHAEKGLDQVNVLIFENYSISSDLNCDGNNLFLVCAIEQNSDKNDIISNFNPDGNIQN